MNRRTFLKLCGLIPFIKWGKENEMSFAYVDSIDLTSYSDNGGRAPLMDTTNNKLYVGTDSSFPKIIKIDGSSFTVAGTLSIGSTNYVNQSGSCIDSINGNAYWSASNPNNILKVDLNTFTLTDTLTNPINKALNTAAIDVTNNYAYFGYSDTTVHKIERLRLSDFSWQGTLDFTSGGCWDDYGLITGGYLYVICYSPAKILKIQLSDFTLIGTFTLTNYSFYCMSTDGTYIYCGCRYDTGSIYQSQIMRIQLSDFSYVDNIVLPGITQYEYARSAIRNSSFCYFGSNYNNVFQIGTSPFEWKATISTGNGQFYSAVVGNNKGYFVEYGYAYPGYVHRFNLESELPISSILMYKFRPVVLA
jgi:hypothetical protein